MKLDYRKAVAHLAYGQSYRSVLQKGVYKMNEDQSYEQMCKYYKAVAVDDSGVDLWDLL